MGKQITDFTQSIEKDYPKTFFGPVSEIKLNSLIPYEGGMDTTTGKMTLRSDLFDPKEWDYLERVITHEASHGGQFFPAKFIGQKAPEETIKLLKYLDRFPPSSYKKAARAKNWHSADIDPAERHADSAAAYVAGQIRKFPKGFKYKTKDEFLPLFYKKLQDEILTTPSRVGKRFPEFGKAIKEVNIKPLEYSDWQKIFKDLQ